MAAPTYDSLAFEVPAGIPKANLTDATTFSGLTVSAGAWTLPVSPKIKLTVGTGAGQFNCISKFYTATASGNTDYDLTALLDPLGNALNLDNARFVVVYNFAVTPAFNLIVDGTVTNAWLAPFNAVATAQLVVPPGWTNSGGVIEPGIFLLGGGSAAGLVTSGTSKVVRLAAGANSVPHGFVICGVDA